VKNSTQENPLIGRIPTTDDQSPLIADFALILFEFWVFVNFKSIRFGENRPVGNPLLLPENGFSWAFLFPIFQFVDPDRASFLSKLRF
jgi:hypothetical protein